MLMHIITDFTASAGAETMLARLLRTSDDNRIVVAPLMGISKRNMELSGNPNVSFSPLGAKSLPSLVGTTLKLARLIRNERPTVILCWMYHAMVVGTIAATLARTGTSLYWTVRQSLDDPAALSRSSRLALQIGQQLSGIPAGIIYNSERAQHLHSQYGYRNDNTTVIPNGFELPEAAMPRTTSPRIFGIAGRYHPQKDHETFFRAAAEVLRTHSDARFIAVGHGLSIENEAVASLVKMIGLPPEKLDLRGELRDMASFYSEIDAFVLSSRTEGFPNVVAEAMSFRKPVVTTDVGDAAAVVGDTGIVVPPRDVDALADGVRSMLNMSPENYASLAHAARHRIETQYALPLVARQYREFINPENLLS